MPSVHSPGNVVRSACNDLAGCPRSWVAHEQLLNCDAAGNHHTSRQHGWAISTLLWLPRQLGRISSRPRIAAGMLPSRGPYRSSHGPRNRSVVPVYAHRILMHDDTQWTVSEVARSSAREFQFLRRRSSNPMGRVVPGCSGPNARMKRSVARRDPPEHDNAADRLVLRVLRRSGFRFPVQSCLHP